MNSNIQSTPNITYNQIRLHEVGDLVDWRVNVHRDLLHWLDANVSHDDVKREMVIFYQSFLRTGEFSFNTKRFGHGFGGTASLALKDAIKSCPFIEMVHEAKPRRCSRVYRFRLRAIEQLPDNRELWRIVSRVLRGYSRQTTLPGWWLRKRCLRWAQWCDDNDHQLKLDLLGVTELGAATFEALERIGVPDDLHFVEDIAAGTSPSRGMSKRQHAIWFHSKLTGGGFPRSFLSKDGRSYHALTNCPKSLRRRLLIDGERLCEADLGASYWYFLATQLPDSEERHRLVRLLHSGRFTSNSLALRILCRRPERN